MAELSLYQWIIIIISAIMLIFGSGLYFRFKAKKKKVKETTKREFGNSLRKIVKVAVGDYVTLPCDHSNLKITVIDIVQENFKMEHFEIESYGANLGVDAGGGLVFGGYSAIETGVNQYKIPIKKFQNEEPCSIYSFHCKKDYFSFMRIFIEHINPHSKEVTLNVFCYSS